MLDSYAARRLDHKTTPGRVRIGCSGWQYRHWRGDFYPAGLPVSHWFHHYARTFDTVEINNSFYRLPEPSTFEKWCEQAPGRFLYAVKASRFLTHMKKLRDPEEPLARFFDHARHLVPHLGPVLYQLPPRWPIDVERLERFLATLPRRIETPDGAAHRVRHVMEFRDPSWYDERVFALLVHHRVALCLHDMQGSAIAERAIGPTGGRARFIYVRFHGRQKYAGRYSNERLDSWADWLAAQARGGSDVFAYFNNDVGGHAPRDAVRLRNRMQLRLATPATIDTAWQARAT